MAGAGDGGSDGDAAEVLDGAGVGGGEVGCGEVSADGPGLGLADASDDSEADELAQPAIRDRHNSDDARILSIGGPPRQPV